MKVLVACEYSGTVRDAFIKRGHEAMSCDILETRQPGPHHLGDVREILNQDWDMMIAFPPCTDLAVSGARHFAAKIADGRQQRALDFVKLLLEAPIPKICLENPVGIISTHIRKPDQIIQPWMFGHEAQKTTCLWLKNLPPLKATKIVGKGEFTVFKSGKRHPKWYAEIPSTGKPENALKRGKTFQGIADAMAEQWGNIHENPDLLTPDAPKDLS